MEFRGVPCRSGITQFGAKHPSASSDLPHVAIDPGIPGSRLYPGMQYGVEQGRARRREQDTALFAASPATGEHRACGIEVAAVMAEALFTEIIGDAAMLYLSQPCVDRTAIAADLAQHQHEPIARQFAPVPLTRIPTSRPPT